METSALLVPALAVAWGPAAAAALASWRAPGWGAALRTHLREGHLMPAMRCSCSRPDNRLAAWPLLLLCSKRCLCVGRWMACCLTRGAHRSPCAPRLRPHSRAGPAVQRTRCRGVRSRRAGNAFGCQVASEVAPGAPSAAALERDCPPQYGERGGQRNCKEGVWSPQPTQ